MAPVVTHVSINQNNFLEDLLELIDFLFLVNK